MSDERDVIADGRRLALFLGDPVVQRAFDHLSGRYIREWELAQDTPAREAAWYRRSALLALQQELQRTVDAGVYAEHQSKA